MQSYAYKGASWANQAQQNRQAAQNTQQMWSQYAPQWSQYGVAKQGFANQQQANQTRQRDDVFKFGMSALGGLLR